MATHACAVRRVLGRLAVAAAALAALPASAQQNQPVRQPDPHRVHDPAIIKHRDTYYVFSTGRGVPVRRSKDLVTWEPVGTVFDSLPAWASREVPGVRDIWAPDISFFNGKYHLYYSLSTFGRNRSVIGLATNRTLDPSSPDFRWEDQGKVVESFQDVSTHNAIDPNLVLDERRQPWLSWGSFWGGVKMRRIDPATGLASREDTTLYSLAARTATDAAIGPNRPRSVEAPFIIRRGDHYYLFLSFDRCCAGINSTYNIRVGRSESVTGPYVDANGVKMTRGGGSLVLAGVGRVRGPGHNAILTEGERQYLVHHFYDMEANGRPRMQIRPLTWKEDGWPVAGEPLAPPPQ